MNELYQKFCVACAAPGHWICASCESSFPKIKFGYCSICSVPFEKSKLVHPCFSCASRAPAYQKHRAPFAYRGVVADMIQKLKYKAEFWVRAFYADSIEKLVPEFKDVDYIIPIPLHLNRLKERGFNQSQFLAEVWQKKLNKPLLIDSLVRNEDTPTQVGQNKIQRLKMLKSAFGVQKPERLQNKKILLVDDVHTTGSTLHAASLALMDAKASGVCATTMAIVPLS